MPAYAVFTNEQLAEIAKARCATLADLGKIEGIGPARVEKYGEAVLTNLRENHETV
jgi:superfamily II DNA helicase RecQ